ncbi:MAG: zinc-ribbon domain-containing protein [Methanoregula sp.]|nr:zinc-ribbon domain-containing protein [Methanoregula sp.]
MGDPELRSDEKVLVRTQGVYVKSIPFEGILTNKRIILIDRAKNLLPPKEIPLVTIKEIEPGENAIRDQIITLSVMAKTGETRQMILTFSRQAGGNRKKERDEWARIIKDNASAPFDQVIRKVIPGSEPVPRRAEPATGQRYEIVQPPVQPATFPADSRPAGTPMEAISPVRRSGTTSPAAPLQPSPAVRQFDASLLGTSIFCSKCGNKVPAESVFCNRCGSPIAQTTPVSAPVQPPTAPTSIRAPAFRPIDREIQSIEPLIERSTVKIPADALRPEPAKTSLTPSFAWDEEAEEEPGAMSASASSPQTTKAAGKGFLPQIFSEKPAFPASGEYPDDTPPPPKPPKSAGFLPGKNTLLTLGGIVVVIVIIAAAALFVYPMLTSGGTILGPGDVTPTPTSSTINPSGTIVFKETPAPAIPPTGVYVRVSYLGGFKGSYGIPDAITTVPGNSGDRVWEVENANGTVQASFEKLDGSSHELLVEIYRDGKALTQGTTTVGHGSVTLSVDTITGTAAEPVTSGGGTTAKPATLQITTNPTISATTVQPTNAVTADATTVAATTAAATTTAAT